MVHFRHRGNVHGGGEGIVGALGEVHMVIGVQDGRPGQLIAPAGDHLVEVHVALGAAARLPDGEGKLLREAPCQNLVAGLKDQILPLKIQAAQGVIGQRAGPLEKGKGADEGQGHALLADGEILKASLGLSAPKAVGRDGDLAHGVMFDAILHKGDNLLEKNSAQPENKAAWTRPCLKRKA